MLLAVIGLILHLAVAAAASYGIWIVAVGFVLLAIGNLFEGV